MAWKKDHFDSWSYSRFTDYDQCPLRAKLKHLDKLPEPKNKYMERGAEIATAGEDYLKKKTNKLHPELKPVKEKFDRLRKIKNLVVEQQWGFDTKWNPVPWNDWNNCWLRVKMDVNFIRQEDNILLVIDNKTGKYSDFKREVYDQQLEIYTAAGIAQYPHVAGIDASLLYTDHNIEYPVEPKIILPAEAKALQVVWNKRVKKMFADRKFAPRPGDHCRYCHFRKSNGGPCKF